MKLYFARHGESVANILREFSNTGTKHPLTEKGVAQAQALADHLSGIRFAQIYSSPVLRATQTAGILSQRLGVPVEITEALRECSVGIYEGTTDPQGWQLHGQVMQDWLIHHRLDSKMPGGESFNEVQARFVPFIEDLIQDDQAQNVLLVGHGALYLSMLPVIFKNIDHAFADQHPFGNTAYALAETGPGGLVCRSWCGVDVPG